MVTMLRNRAPPFLINLLILAIAVLSDDSLARTKRQSPNINVHQIPKTSFSCVDRKVGEYYADPEAHCQVYHVCIPGMHNKMSLISFACPNGTIFSQATRVCTPYERVDCSLTSTFTENVHGGANSRRTEYISENDVDSYVPPPREPPQPPRQSPRNRNTPAPPPPVTTREPPRGNRFRSGASQFRGQQGAATTSAPVRATTTATPTRVAPARPAAFRPPVPARPAPAGGSANVLPPRVTPRPVVSTSTSSYNYEYEYEYDYEDETPAAEQGNARNKREASSADDYEQGNFSFEEKKGFTCQDKVAGGVYADIESNCEMFHICVPLGKYKMLDYKVFCANGTAFDQETGSCRQQREINCENSHFYFQFEKPNQPAPSKKPVLKKKKISKSKKI